MTRKTDYINFINTKKSMILDNINNLDLMREAEKREDVAQNQADLEKELELLSDDYYGGPQTSPSP